MLGLNDLSEQGSLLNGPPDVGDLVQVRSRRWLVEEVVQSTTPGNTPLVRLACADDDNQGQTLDVHRIGEQLGVRLTSHGRHHGATLYKKSPRTA